MFRDHYRQASRETDRDLKACVTIRSQFQGADPSYDLWNLPRSEDDARSHYRGPRAEGIVAVRQAARRLNTPLICDKPSNGHVMTFKLP